MIEANKYSNMMKHKTSDFKLYSCIILMNIFILPVFAQVQLISQDQQPKSFLFRYEGLAVKRGSESSILISKIAEGENKPVNNVEYVISLVQADRVTRNGYKINVTFEHSQIVCSGDMMYKGFNMGAFLIPSWINIHGNLIFGMRRITKPFTLDHIRVIGGQSEVGSIIITDSTLTNPMLQIVETHLIYSPADIQNFENRIGDIDNYYFTSSQLDGILPRIQSINTTEPGQAMLANTELLNAETLIEVADGNTFINTLNLRSFDPAGYLQKLANLKTIDFQKRTALNMLSNAMDAAWYNKGIQALAAGDNINAIGFFNQSLGVNPLYAPAAYRLARMAYEGGNLNDAEDRSRRIMSIMNPDPETQRYTMDLLNNIYTRYLNDASGFNNRGNYDQALESYARARSMCETIRGMICSDQLSQGVQKSNLGIYMETMSDARSALNGGNYDAAERLAGQADSYRKANNIQVNSTDDPNTIYTPVQQGRYDKMVENGKSFYQKNQYQDALLRLDSADNYSNIYSVRLNNDAPSMKQDAAKRIVVGMIDDANDNVHSNHMREAKDNLDRINSLSSKYNLSGDEEITKGIRDIKSKMFSQDCLNAQKRADNWFDKGKNALAVHQYLEASDDFDNSIAVADSNSTCNLSANQARDERLNIAAPSTYQKLIREVMNLQNNAQYLPAISKYNDARTYYVKFDVMKYGLENPELCDFATSTNSNGFIMRVADDYLSKKNLDKSLELYKLIIKRGTPPNYMKSSLESLGVQYALKDRPGSTIKDPSQAALKYTDGDSKMKIFKNAFVKQWKSMK